MTHFTINREPWVLASAMAFGMVLAWWVGRLVGRSVGIYRSAPPDSQPDLISSKLGAHLALFSLLLGFTFSMSLTKNERRLLMVLADSNSIGDFYTCATLIKDPERKQLQTVIRRYAELHLTMARRQLNRTAWTDELQTNQSLQDKMTDLVSTALAEGTPLAVPLITTLNALTSASASRLAAADDRLPVSVIILLFVFGIVTTALDGFEKGTGRSAPLVELLGILSFSLLVSLAVYVTLDLDQPARGLITVSQAPLERVLSSMTK